jgi:hypothetical protein
MNTVEYAIKSLKENPDEWRFDCNTDQYHGPFCLVNGGFNIWIANGFFGYEMCGKGIFNIGPKKFSFLQKVRAHRHIRKIIKRLRNR